ncbi:hypothetical protein Tco_0304985 [Tanacetum coccineum]
MKATMAWRCRVLDDKEDTRSSQEYLNDLEEEYQTRALLSKSKRFFKKGSQRFSSAKATEDTQCHKYFPAPLYKTKSKDFKAKYKKVKAKLALLSPGASASSSTLVKNKGLIAETCELDKEDVSSDDNEVMEVKALMSLAEEERVSVSKQCARNREWVQISIRKKRILGVGQLTEDPSSSGLKDLVFIKSLVDNTKASIPGVERPLLSEAKADESSICSTFFPPLKKPGDAETVSGPKAVKKTLKSISTFKAEALKGIIPNKPSSAPAQENKKASALKSNSAPAKNSKNVKSTNHLHLATVIKQLNDLKLQVSKNQSSQSKDKQVSQNTLQNKKHNSKGVLNFVD